VIKLLFMLQVIISEPNELGDYENLADPSGAVCVALVTGGALHVTTKLNQHFSLKG
jgi:hypothetical protein